MKTTILKSSVPPHESTSPRINPATELISHKESIQLNRCLGSLTVKNSASVWLSRTLLEWAKVILWIKKFSEVYADRKNIAISKYSSNGIAIYLAEMEFTGVIVKRI
jgi:hypothetical protein